MVTYKWNGVDQCWRINGFGQCCSALRMAMAGFDSDSGIIQLNQEQHAHLWSEKVQGMMRGN